ncbi:MAG: FHA domain-containing protein [Caldilineaceae bacterium]|nr:FHA domain-containing protein [Caldilineaceae bacterium]
MSLRWKMIYSCLTGAWGGYLAWLLLDPLLGVQARNVYLDALCNGAVIGIAIGAFMSGFEGVMERNIAVLVRRLVSGLGAGLGGGVLGLLIGEFLFQQFSQTTIMRVIGWALLGLAIGVGEGVRTRSWRRMGLGAVGGLAGGVLGSLAFLWMGSIFALPAFSRALGFTLLGAFIGLFVGLMPVVASQVLGALGTLKVISSGRHEGKEILLDKPVISIGRADGCDLGLYGIVDMQPHHAEVKREPVGYVLHRVNHASLWVNGQPVQQQILQSGDRIKIGGAELLFRASGG